MDDAHVKRLTMGHFPSKNQEAAEEISCQLAISQKGEDYYSALGS